LISYLLRLCLEPTYHMKQEPDSSFFSQGSEGRSLTFLKCEICGQFKAEFFIPSVERENYIGFMLFGAGRLLIAISFIAAMSPRLARSIP